MNRRGQRKPPLYDIALWNNHDLVKENQDKTTNRCEGWHRGLESTIGMQHPNVYRLINALKSIQQLNSITVEKLVAGEKPRQGSKIYQVINERLQRLVLKFEEDEEEFPPLLEFLRGCAHNISL